MNGREKLESFFDSPKLPVSIIICASIWVGIEVKSVRLEMERQYSDRITGSDYVAMQDLLEEKNPTIDWLSASEIRKIQREK